MDIAGAVTAKSQRDSQANVKNLVIESAQGAQPSPDTAEDEMLRKSLEELQQQLVNARKNGDRKREKDTLVLLGEFYLRDRPDRAQELFQEALKLAKKNGLFDLAMAFDNS